MDEFLGGESSWASFRQGPQQRFDTVARNGASLPGCGCQKSQLGIHGHSLTNLVLHAWKLGMHPLRTVCNISSQWFCFIRRVETMKEYKKPARTEVVDRKSTRLNSSHVAISYAVFCF